MISVKDKARYVGSYDTIMKSLKASDRNSLQYKFIYIEYRLYTEKSVKDMRNEYKSIMSFLKKYDVKDNNIEFVIKNFYDNE